MTKFDIQSISQKFVKESIIVDLLASLPVLDSRIINYDFLDKEITKVTNFLGLHMYYDGVAIHPGYGIGVLFISPHGDQILRSVRLTFFDSYLAMNNIVKY